MNAPVVVSDRGARRWADGHPWIYRSDVLGGDHPAGVVRVTDRRRRALGLALWSPGSEIRLRLLSADPSTTVDRAWWAARIREADGRRYPLEPPTTAYRAVYGEADGLPSLIVDRYDAFIVAQLLSAGLEAEREAILGALEDVFRPLGILLRNEAAVRRHEGLPLIVETPVGTVPDTVDLEEAGIRYQATLRTGQKTGAFLDQRENRALVGAVATGRALDVFCYHGLFALHMARRATSVQGVDQSTEALAVAERNRVLNDAANVDWRAGNAFDVLRELDEAGASYDTIVLDPPAFAKRKDAVARALRGYAEINRRALRLLRPGGRLFTATCSFHVDRAQFLSTLAAAAADSGRRVVLERLTGQPGDHPQLLTVPETGYLKGALVRAVG